MGPRGREVRGRSVRRATNRALNGVDAVSTTAPPPRRTRAGKRSAANGPTLSDRYVLGKPLGSGAVAEVLEGEDTRLERPVAVKLLRPELADDEDARKRFEGEARAAAGLAHPNIVQVYDVEVADGRPYLVMERLPGRTLADEIKRGAMDPTRVIEVGAQVLSALAVAHQAGIVHRDVKPGNVLLAPDGTWKVADFGIAKSTESLDTLTATGTVLCTPGYVAPERVNGKPATPASDLYSVGVLLYEALSGRRPFVADNPLAVAHLAQTQDPPPLDSLRTGLDPKLIAVVHRALARDPKKRLKSAPEMRDALLELIDVRPEIISDDPTTEIRPTTKATATQSVPTGFAPSPVPMPSRRMPNLTLLTWIVVGVMALIVVIAVASTGGSGRSAPPAFAPSDSTPVTTAATTPASPLGVSGIDTSNLPAPLAKALQRLENEVQP